MLKTVDLTNLPIPDTAFEKTAFLGSIGKALGRVGPKAFGNWLAPKAKPIEKGLINAFTRMGADPLKTQQRLRGVIGSGIRDAATGAAIGGVLEGGIRGLTAEEGEGGKEFLRGLGSGALTGAGFGAVTGVGGKLMRNTRLMHYQDIAKNTPGLSTKRVAQRGGNMGIRDAFGKAFKAPDPSNPMGKLDQGIARTKLLGGAGILGAEWLVPGMIPTGDAGAQDNPKPPPMPQPQFQPNAPAVYEQPQYYKAGSFKQLTSIDFTKMPSYHL
jgi:hypothetical protein